MSDQPTLAVPDGAVGVACWAEDLTHLPTSTAPLVGGPDDWCDEPHIYVATLDPAVWSVRLTLLCPAHTARLRELDKTHGGIVRVETSVPA